MVATFWVQFDVTGLSYILDNRIYSPPFYTPLATTYPPSVSPENHVIPPPKKKKEKCHYLRSDYLLYGNFRVFEERGGHNVKEPDFFVLFFCFVLVGFFVGGGGVACFSEETKEG